MKTLTASPSPSPAASVAATRDADITNDATC